jgi:hypothetical protein
MDGANTKGALPQVLHTLAAHVAGSRTEMVPGTAHSVFEQAPQRFCDSSPDRALPLSLWRGEQSAC